MEMREICGRPSYLMTKIPRYQEPQEVLRVQYKEKQLKAYKICRLTDVGNQVPATNKGKRIPSMLEKTHPKTATVCCGILL